MSLRALKSQAMVFALCIAAVAFVLTGYTELDHSPTPASLIRPLIIALSCGVLAWGAADRLIGLVSGSVDAAVRRLVAAMDGDFMSPAPSMLTDSLPVLSQSIDRLFAQVRTDIESANSLALFDPVTALPNRLHFRNETEAVIEKLGTGDRAALFFIDLDHFKAVNDTYGHAAGDQLLIMIANRLRKIVGRPGFERAGHAPVIGRLAGDEFTVFLPDLPDRRAVTQLAQQMIAALSDPFVISGHPVRVGASIGIALFPEHGSALTDLMRAADVAMYQSKEGGRGQHTYFTNKLAQKLARRVELDHELRLALESDEFRFHFQPQIELASDRIVSHEVLLRWYHPGGEIRTPAAFMRAADQAGMMTNIGDWSIAALAARLAAWSAQGRDHRLAFNASSHLFEDGRLYERIRDVLEHHNAGFDRLELEVSERLAMESGELIGGQLARLRDHGAMITMDNFGSGFSNIARLRGLPVERIKLDASLTAGIVLDPEARAIVQAYVAMLHGMGRKVVAEGVETTDQLQVLKVMGCDAAQGFAIARPMDADELDRWIARRTAPRLAA